MQNKLIVDMGCFAIRMVGKLPCYYLLCATERIDESRQMVEDYYDVILKY